MYYTVKFYFYLFVYKIAVLKFLLSTERIIIFHKLLVSINFSNEVVFLCATYIPPQSPLHVYSNHVIQVNNYAQQFSKHKISIIGDYNLAKLSWQCQNFSLAFSALNESSQAEVMVCDD